MDVKRVVLIGGSGFVGSNLRASLPFRLVVPSETEADLTIKESLRDWICRDDIVINAAGYANATDFSERGKQLFQSVNVDGLKNLAEVAAEAGVRQLVHISSVAAMGRLKGEGITENMTAEPLTPYAKSKLEGERILAQFMNKIPITILRPTSVFGEGRGLARLFCAAVSKKIIPLPNGGNAKIPFTYIGNITKAVELAINCEPCFGRTFIIGDKQSYPLCEIVNELAKALGKKPRIIPVPIPAAKVGVGILEFISSLSGKTPLLDRYRLDTLSSSVSYSIAAFADATGFVPPYSLNESVNRLAEWYVKNG